MSPTTQGPDCHVTQEAPSLITVPGKGNPRRTVRVDDETWDEFGLAAERLGSERATLVRKYIDWVLGRPGAEAPRRAPDLDSEEGASRS
jgi:hypothetical protein